MELVLYRNYLKEGVNGTLFYNGRFICNTIELPWKENKEKESCIPEGTYDLQVRTSLKFGEHLHVTKVYQRSLILFHPGNIAMKDLKGCIAPVSFLTGEGRGTLSRRAMDILMFTVKNLRRANEQLILTIKKGNYELNRTIQ